MTDPAAEPDATAATSGRRATADILIQLVGRFGNLLLGLVVTVLIVRLLGVEGNGQWAAITAIVLLITSLSDVGLEPTAVRLAAQERDSEPGWLGALVALRLALAGPATVIAAVVCVLSADGDTTVALAGLLVALTIIAGALGSLRVVFQLRVRNGVPIAVMTLNSVLWTAAVILVAAAGGGLVALAACLLAVTLFTAIVQAVLAIRLVRPSLDGVRARSREIMRIGLPLGIGTVLTLAYSKIDQVLLLHLDGEYAAGIYGAAYQLLDKAQFVPAAVMTTIFPIAAAAFPHDRPRVRRVVQRSAEYLAIASFPILAFSLAAAEPFIDLLYGEEFSDASRVLPILMGALVGTCFGYLLGYLAVVMDLQKRTMVYALVVLVFNVVANVLLVPSYGYMAAAWITLASELLVIAMVGRLTFRALGFRPRLPRFGLITASSAVMGVGVWVLGQVGAPILALLVVAPPLYLAALLGLRAASVAELKELAGRGEPAG